ncbi:MAG: hypothetical protein ABIR47_07445 [Candidatus Kapaibacterium sp.]
MAWSDIKPDRMLHYPGEEAFLADTLPAFPAVSTIEQIYLPSASMMVLRDLGRELRLNPDNAKDMAIIDALATASDDPQHEDHVGELQQAIAYKQLELIYTRFPGAAGDLNDTKRKQYARAYAEERSRFYSLLRHTGAMPATTVRVRL